MCGGQCVWPVAYSLEIQLFNNNGSCKRIVHCCRNMWLRRGTVRILYEYFVRRFCQPYSVGMKIERISVGFRNSLVNSDALTAHCAAKFRFVLHFNVATCASGAIRCTRAPWTKSQSMNSISMVFAVSFFGLCSAASALQKLTRFTSHRRMHNNCLSVSIVCVRTECMSFSRFTLHSNYIDFTPQKGKVFDQTNPHPPATASSS